MNKINKKGFARELLESVFIFLPMIVIISLFVVIPAFQADRVSIGNFEKDQLIIDRYKDLLNYARTPVDYGYTGVRNMGELISWSYTNNDYKELQRQTIGYLKRVYGSDFEFWKLRFKIMPENRLLEDLNEGLLGKKYDGAGIKYVGTINVPLYRAGQYIQVDLFRVTPKKQEFDLGT